MTAELARQARRATIVFWIIAALFVTQMGWWIYFQYSHGGEELALAEQLHQRQPQLAADGWQRHIERLTDSLTASWRELPQTALRSGRTANLEGWSKIVFDGPDGRQLIGIRRPDSLGTAGRLEVPIRDGLVTLFMQGTTVQEYLDRHFPGVNYVGTDDTLTAAARAVTATHLSATDEVTHALLERRARHMRMFLAEGGFFVLLILFGAVVIHRALRRTIEFEQRQQNFLAAVTHELKAPLASIRLFAETLAARELPEGKRQECLARITQDVERLHALIDDILEAGVFARRTFHSQLDDRDLSAILIRTVEQHKPRADRARLALRQAIQPGVYALVDESHIRRVFDAVLDNAIKYSQPNGGRLGIDVNLTAHDGEAIVTVADQGIGLEEADRKKVFERFYRAGDEMTRKVAGSGLGLYLAGEIVRSHKGRISLTSPGPGEGVTVEIRLPLSGRGSEGTSLG